jgi:hypothetical protein
LKRLGLSILRAALSAWSTCLLGLYDIFLVIAARCLVRKVSFFLALYSDILGIVSTSA